MPNWIYNRLRIIGNTKQIRNVFDKYNTNYPAKLSVEWDGSIYCKKNNDEFARGYFNLKNGQFRYEKTVITGLPDEWELVINEAFNRFPDFNKIVPQPENLYKGILGKKEEEMCEKEGIPNWYDWNIENWGSKWNCSDCSKNKNNTFTFYTPWTGVSYLIKELSKQNENIEFIYEYIEQGVDKNFTSFKFLNGKEV